MSTTMPQNVQPLTDAGLAFNDLLQEVIDTPPAIVTRASNLADMVAAISIEDDDDYELACEDLADIKAHFNDVEAIRKGMKAPIIEAGKSLDAFFKAPLEYCKNAESALKSHIKKHMDKIEAAAVVATKVAEKAKSDAIEHAREHGDEVQADLLENAVVPTVSLVVQPKGNVSKRTTYKAEVTDLALLLAAIIDPDNQIATSDLVVINQAALDKLAKVMKDKQVLAGVKFVPKNSVAIGRSKKPQ